MRSLAMVFSLAAVLPLGGAATGPVATAAARFEQQAAKVAEPLRAEFRALGAQALQPKHPDFSHAAPTPPLPAGTAGAPLTAEVRAAATGIQQTLRQFRGLPSDADRARVAIGLASRIRALPGANMRLAFAGELCNLATEGDLGPEALAAVAEVYADGIKGAPADARQYLELASLLRYEHVSTPLQDPALDAALALLDLREALHQEAGFVLAALDGKTYSLDGLRGKVVLLNFWATWCPPCRKEMPDMERLYRELLSRGLVVLAVSDEKREVVEKFLADKRYTFPILLDPARAVHAAFDVEGIPQSFLFDREGRLVAQSIDMRTERQFRKMFEAAGLE